MTTCSHVSVLTQFGVLRFTGADAQTFLQGQLSCDVSHLQPAQAVYGSYNTPQGRMLASFLLWRDGADYYMQLPRTLAEPIRKRLAMYILRAKVKAEDASGAVVMLGLAAADAAVLKPWFQDLPPTALTLTTAPDMTLLRLAADRFQIIAAPARAKALADTLAQTASAAETTVWDRLEIRAGIPWITEATQDQFVPQMANLDLIGGVSFSKGCYPGQEIVARMHYLGRLKQRMYLAHIATVEAPAPGDKLFSAEFGGQACGAILNAAPSPEGGFDVLAVMQISSAGTGAVRSKSPDGALLEFLELPYKA